MAEKEKQIPLQHLDRRVVERYIKRGLIDEKDYARHLKGLEDLSDKAGSVETEFTSVDGFGPTR